MAKLRIEIGALGAEATIGDARAAALVADYIAAYGGPESGTHQQRLRWFVGHLAGHVQEVARSRRAAEAAEAARVAVLDEAVEEWK